VTAEILNIMKENGIRKVTLAQELGYSKAHIARLLGGDRNMTLDTISDIAMALGMDVEFTMRPKKVVQNSTEHTGFFELISNDASRYNQEEPEVDSSYSDAKITSWVA
jgi:plasmid maintenance system antidote protein VapI